MTDEEFYQRGNMAWKLIQRLERKFGVDFVSLEDGERLHLLFPQDIDPSVKTAIMKVVTLDLEMVNTIVRCRAKHPEAWSRATPPPTVGWA